MEEVVSGQSFDELLMEKLSCAFFSVMELILETSDRLIQGLVYFGSCWMISLNSVALGP